MWYIQVHCYLIAIYLLAFNSQLKQIEAHGAYGYKAYTPERQQLIPNNNYKSNVENVNGATLNTQYYSACPSGFTGLLPYVHDCHSFLNCYEGQTHIQNCGPGTEFDAQTRQCGPATAGRACGAADARQGQLRSLTTAANIECPINFSGLLPHPSDCAKFIQCDNGNAHVKDCGPGTAFDAQMMACDFAHKVHCNSALVGNELSVDAVKKINKNVDLLCPAGMSGNFPHPFDNTRFLVCVMGQTGIQNCEPNTVYSISQRRCINKSALVKQKDCVSYNVAEEKYNDPLTLVQCPPQMEGMHMYPYSDKKMLKCDNGKMQIMECPFGYRFNYERLACELIPNKYMSAKRPETVTMPQNEHSHKGFNYPYQPITPVTPIDHKGFVYPYQTPKPDHSQNRFINSGRTADSSYGRQQPESPVYRPQPQPTAGVYEPHTMPSTSHAQYQPAASQPPPSVIYVQCPQGILKAYPHPFDNTKYLACRNQQLQVQSCAVGQVFSLKEQQCRRQDTTTINDYVPISQNVHNQEDLVTNAGQIKCPQYLSGNFVHPFDANKNHYLHCQNGQIVIGNCEANTKFDAAQAECVPYSDIFNNFDDDNDRQNAQVDQGYIDNAINCPQSLQSVADFYPYPFANSFYLICQFDRTNVRPCMYGTIFELSQRSCVPGYVEDQYAVDSMSSNKLLCPPTATGKFIYPFESDKFIRCQNGRTFIEQCPSGQVFSITRKECFKKSIIPEVDRVTYNIPVPHQKRINPPAVYEPKIEEDYLEILCQLSENGSIQPHPHDCTKYVECQNGQPLVRSCGPRSSWNIERGTCSTYNAQDCNEAQNAKILNCPTNQIGLSAHPSSCEKFLNCANGVVYEQSCPAGTAWDNTALVCDFRENVFCQKHNPTGNNFKNFSRYK